MSNNFLEIPQIYHAVSTIRAGNMSVKYGEANQVYANRRAFLQEHKIPYESISVMNLEHRPRVLKIISETKGLGITNFVASADAIFTQTPKLTLFMLTADCLPISLYDPTSRTVGLIHGSWLTLDENIISKCFTQIGTLDYSQTRIYLGPCIASESYIQSNPSQLTDSRWQTYIHQISGETYQVDIKGFALNQLLNLGIKKEYIHDSNIDTRTNPNYFSHVGEKQDQKPVGRFASVIGIRG